MTENTATPTRKPSGAAVAGAYPRPKNFPRQLVILVSDETADYIEAAARDNRMSKSEVGRTLLEAGIEAGQAAAAADAAARL